MNHDRKVLFESFKKYWYLIALTLLFSFLTAIFEGVGIGMIIPFLQNLTDVSGDTFRTGWDWVDRWLLGVGEPQLERMYRICGLILGATWLRSTFGYLASLYGVKAKTSVVEDLRMRIVDQLRAVSLSYFSKARSGEIINTFTSELTRVATSLQIFVSTVRSAFLLLAYGALMMAVSWELSLLVLVLFTLASLGLTSLIKRIRKSGRKMTRASGRFTSAASEFIGGIRTVVAFNMQSYERERLNRATQNLARATVETQGRAQLVGPLSQGAVTTILMAVIVVALQFFVFTGKLDIALLLAFLFALLRFVPVLQEINKQRGNLASVRAAISNVVDLVDPDGKPFLEDGTRPVERFREAIEFENVSFAYEPGQLVLEDINLRIERGKTTALVGASGAGKSTLVDLIPRFYDPTEGRILLDGVDLREFRVASLRDKIAMVSQDTFIFNDTVRANIGYGAPEASFEEIVEAARQANALEFIEELPRGFNTVLGDRGVRLSGGQRQRLAIARALLRDPEILILDEATSALDSVSEKLVQESLERLMQGRTVVAIAHRLSTVEHADWVVVLEEGRVVEQGTYAELLARKGQLWEYHSIQFQAA